MGVRNKRGLYTVAMFGPVCLCMVLFVLGGNMICWKTKLIHCGKILMSKLDNRVWESSKVHFGQQAMGKL